MKPILSGKAALIVGAVGTVLAGAAVFIPAPWGTLAAILGFAAAGLAGLAAPAPRVTEGRPILQGGALTAATAVGGLLASFYGSIPPAWQPVALSVAALVAWLTGKALPALGTPRPEVIAAGDAASAEVTDKAKAVEVLRGGPQP